MKCKKNLQLLSFFVLISLSVSGQTFSSCDFERLIMQHPLMNQYDPESGRFRGTPGEIISPAEVDSRIASTHAQIDLLQEKRKSVLADSLKSGDESGENELWENLAGINQRVMELKQSLMELDELKATGGVPPVSRNLPIARQIILDTRQKFPKTELLLNRLPRFFMYPPDFLENELRRFFRAPQQIELLKDYLEQVPAISLLFPATSEPVLIKRGKE
ncbi:MAG: hypothetical protein AB1403_02985 [Candidatus Riflebacteria bacterium]